MSLARNVFVQTSFTLGSRVLGFARDLALNSRFGGQGALMDCWATAQMLPNLFRRLFAEGAFAQAFVPVFAKARATEGAASADQMASQAMAFIMTVVILICVGFEFALRSSSAGRDSKIDDIKIGFSHQYSSRLNRIS